MATCRQCGYAAIGSSRRCAKCGAELEQGDPLREAVQAVSDDVTGVTRAREDAARSSRLRRVVARVGLAALLGLGILTIGYGARWKASRDSVPLAQGTAWVFVDPAGHRVLLRVGEPATFEGVSALAVACEREGPAGVEPAGTGYVSTGWSGVELIGVEGSVGRHLMRTLIIPFPYGPGSDWTSRVGGSWVDASWSVHFVAAPARETVTVKAGSYDALPITFHVSARAGPPVLSGKAWLADGVGPVRFQLDRAAYGVAEQSLELAEFHAP